MKENKRYLIIQTSFIGDVILATSLVESLKKVQGEAEIDFLLRKGNEGILENNPQLEEVHVWDKGIRKYRNLWSLIKTVREKKYDVVINLQRFASTGLIAYLSGAKEKWGFSKNPFSFCYSRSLPHEIGNGKHETERNFSTISHLENAELMGPAIYPSESDLNAVSQYKSTSYICIAPTSVWFTKQLPVAKWQELIAEVPANHTIYLLGAPADKDACEKLRHPSNHHSIVNLAGQLSLLQSAALMKDAKMNFVNDSAPMHLASAVNAPCTAIFCSTVPAFGFGPLSQESRILETKKELNCRPCGLHGKNSCPEGHFECAFSIDLSVAALK